MLQLCRFYKRAIKVFVLPLVCSMAFVYICSILEMDGLSKHLSCFSFFLLTEKRADKRVKKLDGNEKCQLKIVTT